MGFFINGKVVDDANSNYSGALKNIRYLTEDDDLNAITEQGIYLISKSHGEPLHNPTLDVIQNRDYWTLMVIHHDDGQVQQFAISEYTMAYRWITWGVVHGDWKKFIFEDDLKKISDRIQALENKIGGVIKGLYIKLFSCFFDNGKVAI